MYTLYDENGGEVTYNPDLVVGIGKTSNAVVIYIANGPIAGFTFPQTKNNISTYNSWKNRANNTTKSTNPGE